MTTKKAHAFFPFSFQIHHYRFGKKKKYVLRFLFCEKKKKNVRPSIYNINDTMDQIGIDHNEQKEKNACSHR